MREQLTTRQTAVVMRWHFDRFTRAQQRRFCEYVKGVLDSGDFTLEGLAESWNVTTADVVGWHVLGKWDAAGMDECALDLAQDLEAHSVWLRSQGWLGHAELCPCNLDGGTFIILA